MLQIPNSSMRFATLAAFQQKSSAFNGAFRGRYWTRTSDPYHVKVIL